MRFWKRMTVMTLCLGLLVGSIPLLSHAEDETAVCSHHEEHNGNCGYREAEQGVDCGHQHDESCGYQEAAEEVPCTCQPETVHGGNCTYTPAVEGNSCECPPVTEHGTNCSYREASAGTSCDCPPAEEGGDVQHVENCGFEAPTLEIPCDCGLAEGRVNHVENCGFVAPVPETPCNCTPETKHAEGCPYTPAREEGGCTHKHDAVCGYKEAAEAAECTFSCTLCTAEEPDTQNTDPEGFYAVDAGGTVYPAGQRLELLNGAKNMTFYLDGTPVAPSSLKAAGVAKLEAAADAGENVCTLTPLGQGMGAVTMTDSNGSVYVLEVGVPIDVNQKMIFQDPVSNEYFGSFNLPENSSKSFYIYRAPASEEDPANYTKVTSGITCGGVAAVTEGENGLFTVGATGEGYGYLYHLDSDGRVANGRFQTESAGGSGGSGPNHQQFTVSYGGKNITIGLGEMFDGALHMFSPGVVGDYDSPNADWPFQRQIVLGAMEAQNNGNGTVALAPAEFYDCISNVKAEIISCENADGSTNGSNCFLVDDPTAEFVPAMQMQATKRTIQGVGMHQFFVMADPGKCFEADIKVTFDLTLGGETKTYTIDSRAGYWEVPVFEITAPGNANELNDVLASYANLEAYLKDSLDEADYNAFRQLSSNGPGPENPMIYIRLPEASYDAPIRYNVQIPQDTFLGNIELYGAGAGKTILPGLEINGYLTHVWNIGFVSNGTMDSGIQVTDNGIVVEQVCNCSFTGFDYGICNDGKKYVSCVRYCTFNQCEYGIYMDCIPEEDALGRFTDGDNHNNTFQGCRYAVWLVNLPKQMSSYQYRMYNSIFRNNFKDFHITTKGNKHYYYFHRNYYDGVYSEASPLSLLSSAETFRAAAIETDANTTAVVVTNPCRVSSAEDSDLWVFGGDGQEARIFAGEAGDMLISGEAFAAGDRKEITIIDNEEAEVATWIFGNRAS